MGAGLGRSVRHGIYQVKFLDNKDRSRPRQLKHNEITRCEICFENKQIPRCVLCSWRMCEECHKSKIG
jgi:hypothetical protein